MKFGGSSVANADRIAAVLNIVEAASKDEQVLLVFSAMKGITDDLLNAATEAEQGAVTAPQRCAAMQARHLQVIEQIVASETADVRRIVIGLFEELAELLHGVYLVRECSPRTRDLIVSHGELLNCTVIEAVMRSHGLNAHMVDSRLMVRTDSTHGSAAVDFSTTAGLIRSTMASLPGENPIAVITGFIASDSNGVTTTLGRNGSDYTASLVGSALEVDVIEIWTDVDGVYSADPRYVDHATVLDGVTYREAMELSYFGAEVIHPYTMIPAIETGTPLVIRNTMNPAAPGTVISSASSSRDTLITGIASIESVALLNVEGSGMVGISGIAGRIFGVLAAARINIIMISQASSEHSICFIVRDEQAEPAVRALQSDLELEIHQKKIEEIQVQRDLEIVAVIGANMRGRPGISGRVFSSLGDAEVNVLAIAQGSTEMNISFVVHRDDRRRTLNAVHSAFFPAGE
jgi:aspartokinase/homoserine dehydrogenase 1